MKQPTPTPEFLKGYKMAFEQSLRLSPKFKRWEKVARKNVHNLFFGKKQNPK